MRKSFILEQVLRLREIGSTFEPIDPLKYEELVYNTIREDHIRGERYDNHYFCIDRSIDPQYCRN